MNDIWDFTADLIRKGDCLRDVSPIIRNIRKCQSGFFYYTFTDSMLVNPKY